MTVFTVNTNEGHDYTYEMHVHNLQMVREQTSQRILQSMQEAEVLLEAFLDVVTEADGDSSVKKVGKAVGSAVKAPIKAAKAAGAATDATAGNARRATQTVKNGANAVRNGAVKAGRKAKDIIAKVIEFFKNIYARFMDNMQNLFQSNTKWVEDRKDEFAKINYGGLSTEMVPYWDGKEDVSGLRLVASTFSSTAVKRILTNSDAVADITKPADFHNKHMKEYLDSDGDLKEGLKNYFRVGAAGGKDRVNLSGSNLRNVVNNTFIPTILNYNGIVTSSKGELEKINRELSNIAAEMDRRSLQVQESALFGRDFMDTEVATNENLIAIFEAEQPHQNKNNVKDSSTGDRTKVEVTKDGRSEEQKQGELDNNQHKELISNTSDNMLRLLNNISSTQQLVVTSHLTVMEERYTSYMNALKAIWQAGNTRGGRNKEETAK